MKDQHSKKARKKPIRKRTQLLLGEIGSSFKFLRKSAGYGNSTDFAITRGVPEGSYGKHEAGIENMTIDTLVAYMNAHGLENEDVFNHEFLRLGKDEADNTLAKSHLSLLSDQVRHQVKAVTGNDSVQLLDDKDVLDLHTILIEGNKPTSKKGLLKSIQLHSKTDRFEKLLNLLESLELMQMTDPDSPNSPKQKYYTTEAGKKVLRLGNAE